LKTLHVIPAIAPRYGGPSNVIVSMVRALNRLGETRAEIATTDADGANGSIDCNSVPADLPVHWFRHTWSERWKYAVDLRDWLRQHTGDYDLIHIHALWSFSSSAAARAAVKAGVPYILRPAGMLSDYSWNHRGWRKRLYWWLTERHTIGDADAFHVTSDEEAAEVRALEPETPVFVIANGVDSAAFTTQKNTAELRRRCGPSAADKSILLYMSRLHPKKGITDRLLPAVAAMESTCFVAIVGGEDSHAPGFAREVMAAVDDLGLRGRVALLGEVTGDDRWALFDGADAFVLPSHSENFGVVVAEAMARGCPVVVTDAVQSSAHVAAAGAGVVVPGDVLSLASALDRILADGSMRISCSEAGREYAARSFHWDQIALQIRQMYEDCLLDRDEVGGASDAHAAHNARILSASQTPPTTGISAR
jgi:glycosyltransferase involved in cell wall biosynthesis